MSVPEMPPPRSISARCCQRIASLNPTWQNRYNLALSFLYAGQPAQASNLRATLHTEQPTNAYILIFLGTAFEAQQKMPDALEAYRAAVVADPSNPDRLLDYTRLLMDTDKYDEAIQLIRWGWARLRPRPLSNCAWEPLR
jgi:predicted Zn-dependent protease